MAKIEYGNYREMTIPQLEMIIRQHRQYFQLANEKKVPVNDPFFSMICEQNNKATEALVIAKMESRLYNLKQELGIKEYEYDLKYMGQEDFKKKWEGE